MESANAQGKERMIPVTSFQYPIKNFIEAKSVDGTTKLQTYRYPAYHPNEAKKPPKACVSFFHGFGNHVGTYAFVAKQLSENGYEVVGYDYKGWGESEGEPGIIDSFEQFSNDGLNFIVQVREFLKGQYPGGEAIKIVGMGNSLGAGLVLGLLSAHHSKSNGQFLFDSIILVVPGLGQDGPMDPVKLEQLKSAAQADPGKVLQPTPAPPMPFLADYNKVAAHYTGGMKARTVLSIQEMQAAVMGFIHKLTIPVHASTGKSDPVAPHERVVKVVESMGTAPEHKEVFSYEGNHMILVDGWVSDEVIKNHLAFLDKHL